VGDGRRSPSARLGILGASRQVDSERERSALLTRAAELGWREGDSLAVEDRWADGRRDAVLPLSSKRLEILAGALLFIGDAVLTTVIPSIVALVDQLQLPAFYSDRAFVESGGLMAYAADPVGVWRRAGDFVDNILRGAKPAELPVELPTTFHFSVNQQAARAIGLMLPSDVAAQVTEWI
jgi:putative ABC transport system substrate-binding protein